MGVACNGCGHENRLSASYCGNCAQPLAGGVECPQCATPNPSSQNYCNSCGSPLAETKRARAASIGYVVTAAISTVSGRFVGVSLDPGSSGDWNTAQGLAHAATITLTFGAIVVVGVILAATRLWGLGSTPSQITLAEEAFLQVAHQIEFEGWVGLSHGILDGALTGYAYVLSFWTNFIGDDIGMARLLSGVASLASIGVSYLLVTHLFNRRVALFAFFLMSVGV